MKGGNAHQAVNEVSDCLLKVLIMDFRTKKRRLTALCKVRVSLGCLKYSAWATF